MAIVLKWFYVVRAKMKFTNCKPIVCTAIDSDHLKS